MKRAIELHIFGSVPEKNVTLKFKHTRPRYIGLRVMRYGPRTIKAGTCVNGQTPTLFQRNNRSAQTLRSTPSARNIAPAAISSAVGRKGALEIIIGTCAVSAMSNPFGGRTRDLFKASSVISVSLQVSGESHEVSCWPPGSCGHRSAGRAFAGMHDRSCGFPSRASG